MQMPEIRPADLIEFARSMRCVMLIDIVKKKICLYLPRAAAVALDRPQQANLAQSTSLSSMTIRSGACREPAPGHLRMGIDNENDQAT